MPARAERIPPWLSGDYVLGTDLSTPIGPVRVAGLGDVVQQLSNPGRSWPDLNIAPASEDARQWFLEWSRNLRTYRDFIIRDNGREKWFHFKHSWLKRFGRVEDGCLMVINGASISDEPRLEPGGYPRQLGIG